MAQAKRENGILSRLPVHRASDEPRWLAKRHDQTECLSDNNVIFQLVVGQ